MNRLARLGVRWPKTVLLVWALAVILLALIGRGVEDKLVPTQLLVPGTETNRWSDLREDHFGEDAAVLLTGPAEEIESQGPPLYRALARREHTTAISPWSGGESGEQLRPTPEEALIVLDLEVPPGEDQGTIIPPLERFIDDRVSAPVEPHLSGLAPLGKEINEASVDSIHQAELYAFPVLIIVLLLVFRTPIAAAIPLIVALATVQAGSGVIALLTEVIELDSIALSLASMIGLALGVDYSLLIVTRFREGLDQGQPVRGAASLAANTAGRTAVFAGTVLVGIMVVTLLLSPGSVLLSSSIGAIVVTLISMVGAALVTPAAVRILGLRVEKWPIGLGPLARVVPRRRGAGFGGTVQRLGRRPALTAGLVLVFLLIFAAPVFGLDTIPPDPRQLPEGSKGLDDFHSVREAGFGPSVDVAIAAPEGAVTDPERLRQISDLEDQLAEVQYTKTVVGPGTIGEQTRPIRQAPERIEMGKKQIERAKTELTRLAEGLRAATGGVGQLRSGLGEAAGGARALEVGTSAAQAGSAELSAGTARAAAGARRLAAGNERARRGIVRLEGGLGRARSGGGRLAEGAAEARAGADRISAGAERLSNALNDRLAPGADELEAGLREGQARLRRLRTPAQVTEDQLQRALDTLTSMTVGKTDPLFVQALSHVGIALGAATGRNPVTGDVVLPDYPGLAESIRQAAVGAGEAAAGADRLGAGIREAGAGAERLSGGANRLGSGLKRLGDGIRRLEDALARIQGEVSGALPSFERLAEGSARLAGGGLDLLAAGSERLSSGLGRIRAGQTELAVGLESAIGQSASLETGLGTAAVRVADVRDDLVAETGPFRGLRDLGTLEEQSPGFFDSGFVTVAAIQGAPKIREDSARFLIDSDQGGNVGRITVLPDVPTNDPRTALVVDQARDVVDRFKGDSGMDAEVGGSAAQLVDFDRATQARIPFLVLGIALVTYLMLVPILRSVLLPLIAVVLNLITVAVAFGVLTLLFVGDDPLLGGAGALDVISVAGIFSITFALSIDYQVFLLTRMREEFVRTQSNEKAIQFGIEKTGKVVTGAAAIMVAVFVAFAASEFAIIKQFGVGLAVAVLIDATIVRLALLPATMRLFGARTWWIPDWLDERLPLLDVEGSQFEHETAHVRPHARPVHAGGPPGHIL